MNRTSGTASTPPYRVGQPIEFSGYVDDFDNNVSALQFSLDEGAHWTTYRTPEVDAERGVRWRFAYTPEHPGRYLLKARAVDGAGNASPLVSGFPFEVLPAAPPLESLGAFHLRAVGGGPLRAAAIFRSGELSRITPQEGALITGELGVRSVYDIRTRWEVAARPEPYLVGAKTVALEPSTERRRKDAGTRLAAGVISEYGAPEERMRANYRRYAREYPLIGMALRSIATEGCPALIHCENGKDRTGVVCAVLLRLAGAHEDEIMEDYLATNRLHADAIAAEAERLGAGMTDAERAVLLSFLEARPSYLDAFFSEIDTEYGSFEQYVAKGLRLTSDQREALGAMIVRA